MPECETKTVTIFVKLIWCPSCRSPDLAMPRRNSDDTEALSIERRIPHGGFVAKHFYRHGLLCATYPRPALFFTFLIIFWACFPLLYIPIYSGRAQTFVEKIHNGRNSQNQSEEEPPRWRSAQKPEVYIQQVRAWPHYRGKYVEPRRPDPIKKYYSVDLRFTGIRGLWLAENGHVTLISQCKCSNSSIA